MRLPAVFAAPALLLCCAACGPDPVPSDPPGPATQAPTTEEEKTTPRGPWIDTRGTSVLGFGILRLVPPDGGRGRFRVRYRDTPDGYTITDNAQLFVLPGDAFAERPMAYADQFLAFARTPPYPPSEESSGPLNLDVEVEVDGEQTVLVAYGPWTGPDTGRPPGDEHTFTLWVDPLDPGGAFEWLESEAGEMITTNWSGRPELARGGPAADPVTDRPVWIEVRPLILYDASLARAAGEEPERSLGHAPAPDRLLVESARMAAAGRDDVATDLRERAEDLIALAARRDRRIVLTPELARRFRRVPIRWR